jgi:heme-degrading monooxygenase HmoA
MILECAHMQVRDGQSVAFEGAFAEAPGDHRLDARLPLRTRCSAASRRPGHYLLLVEWDTVADHEEGFRKSPQYQRWKQLLHHFYDPFPHRAALREGRTR